MNADKHGQNENKKKRLTAESAENTEQTNWNAGMMESENHWNIGILE